MRKRAEAQGGECLASDCNFSCDVDPGANEYEDGRDNDCDGQTDEVCGLKAGGWAILRYDLRRTGHSLGIEGPDQPTLAWKQK